MADDDPDKDTSKDDAGKAGGQDDDLTADELAALGDPGKRAIERIKARATAERERADALAEKASKYDEQVEANKTEQQRRDEAAKAATERAEKAEAKAMRLEVAVAAGLPVTWAARLVGNTQAELEADAKALAEDRAATTDTTTVRRRTTSDADKGGDGPGGGFSAAIRRGAGVQ